MSYNTTIVIYNDSINRMTKDKAFGTQLADSISLLKPNASNIIGNGYGRAICTHHSNLTSLVAVGHDTGHLITKTNLKSTNSQQQDEIELLKHLADKLGYNITPKKIVDHYC